MIDLNRKILALVLALAAVAAAVVLAVTLNDDTAGGNAPGQGTADNAPSLPGLEDGIFNPVPEETKEPDKSSEPTVPDPTESIPLPTIPDGPVNPDAGPKDPDADVPSVTPPVGTEPEITEPQQTEPAVTEPQQTQPVRIPEGEIDYETFVAMDPALQRAYMESFESMEAFFEWYNAAKEAYEQAHPSIDVGDGVIDLEDLIG